MPGPGGEGYNKTKWCGTHARLFSLTLTLSGAAPIGDADNARQGPAESRSNRPRVGVHVLVFRERRRGVPPRVGADALAHTPGHADDHGAQPAPNHGEGDDPGGTIEERKIVFGCFMYAEKTKMLASKRFCFWNSVRTTLEAFGQHSRD